MVDQSNFTKLHGVQVIVVHDIAQLRDTIAQQGKHKRVLVMDSPKEDREDLIEDVQASLAFVDEYIFCYKPEKEHIKRYEDSDDDDVEPDSLERFPRLVQSRLQIDVPYVFARSQEQALWQAWRRLQHGDSLIVVTPAIDETLTTLQHISASVPHSTTGNASAIPRPDEDPSS